MGRDFLRGVLASQPAFINEVLDAEAAERCAFAHAADGGGGGAGLLTAERPVRGHEPRHGLAMTGDDDLLAGFDQNPATHSAYFLPQKRRSLS